MKNYNRYKVLTVVLFVGISFTACRKEAQVIPEQVQTLFAPQPNAVVKGMYVLNEGNMNSNKASLDFVDYTKGLYDRNIYNQINPDVTKGLGDVGNDIGIYGSKVYIVVNNSNKVEVLNVKTGKRLGQIDIVNCRNVTFHNNHAYVSAYLGTVGDPNAPNGIVAEIDTNTLAITRKVTVGRQPEEMAVVGEKLYVANSGGYSPPNYERTLSVIDLASFTELKRIDVAINLEKVKADQYGNLYVTSRGDYYTIQPDLFLVDTKTDQVSKDFKLPVSNLWIDGDIAYMYSVAFSYVTGKNTITYSMINVKDQTVSAKQFITDGTQAKITVPYGIAVNPVTKEVYVADAKDYVTPGILYCFDTNGKKEWQVTTGDIPGHFAFTY
jgi:DNA-binding beta-propeller fold protein YncE